MLSTYSWFNFWIDSWNSYISPRFSSLVAYICSQKPNMILWIPVVSLSLWVMCLGCLLELFPPNVCLDNYEFPSCTALAVSQIFWYFVSSFSFDSRNILFSSWIFSLNPVVVKQCTVEFLHFGTFTTFLFIECYFNDLRRCLAWF